MAKLVSKPPVFTLSRKGRSGALTLCRHLQAQHMAILIMGPRGQKKKIKVEIWFKALVGAAATTTIKSGTDSGSGGPPELPWSGAYSRHCKDFAPSIQRGF